MYIKKKNIYSYNYFAIHIKYVFLMKYILTCKLFLNKIMKYILLKIEYV